MPASLKYAYRSETEIAECVHGSPKRIRTGQESRAFCFFAVFKKENECVESNGWGCGVEQWMNGSDAGIQERE